MGTSAPLLDSLGGRVVERDALLHRQVAEGVGTSPELEGIWVIVRETRGRAWWGVAGRVVRLEGTE